MLVVSRNYNISFSNIIKIDDINVRYAILIVLILIRL